ncbi:hypothetical protein KL906_004755 [Ogataea polymorpha]|nr:hypothetical protein KL906_004755 [Ogataea polymorpha]KAG7913909.1 hypothetical protein KL927_004888 [Ogataea polymorpha]
MAVPVKLAGSPAEKQAAADAIYRFALSLDIRDPELFDSSFTEDGSIKLLGEKATSKQERRNLCYNRVADLDTAHIVSNFRINIEDSKASLTAVAYAQHFGKGKGLVEGTKFLLSGGLYRAELVKDTTDDIWRIKDLVIDLHWTDGDMAVFQDK